MLQVYQDSFEMFSSSDQFKLLFAFSKSYLITGREGISLEAISTFLEDVDETLKTKIKSLDLFASLATNDNIVHYKLFRPLLYQVNDDKVNVIKVGEFWDNHMDIGRNGDVSETEWMARLTKLNTEIDESQMMELFSFTDMNNDEFIDKFEFVLSFFIKFKAQRMIQLQNFILSMIQI